MIRSGTSPALVACVLLAAIVAWFPLDVHGVRIGAWTAIALSFVYAVTVGGRAAALGWADAGAPPRWTWRELGGLGALIAIAGFMRCWQLDVYPAWVDYDDVQNAWIGGKLIDQWRADGSYQAVLEEWASGNESAFMYLLGLTHEALGISVAAMRIPTALAGTLTIGALYLLARELHGARLAQVSSAFAAIAPWHVQMSREAKQPHWVPLFVATALLFLARALAAPRGARRWRNLVACGLATGAGLHFYEAFRIFPLVVAVAIAIDGRKRLARAAAELAVVALTAAVVAFPLLRVAYRDWGLYMGHVTSNSGLSAAREADSTTLLAHNAAITLHHVVFALPRDLAGTDWLPSAHAALPALLLAGAFALVRSGASRTRLLLGATAVAMAAPFLLPRFALTSPRRFGGEFVPMYLAIGAAALGLGRAVRAAWGPRASRILGLAGAAALAAELPVCFEAMRLAPPWLPRLEQRVDQLRLRWILGLARDHDVWLSCELARDDYFTRFVLRHPHVHALGTSWPLPDAGGERAVAIVGLRGPARALACAAFAGTEHAVALRDPGDVVRDDPEGRVLAYEPVVLVEAAAIRAKWAPVNGAPDGFTGELVVHTPGAYRFSRPVSLDGIAVAGDQAVGLAWGPHALSIPVGPPLAWRTPDNPDPHPIPRGRLWMPLVPLPRGPAVAEAPTDTIAHTRADVPAAPAYEFNSALQDVEPDGRGGLWILDADHTPLKHWDPADDELTPVALHRRGADGALTPLDPPIVPLEYRNLVLARFRLAASGSHLAILDRERRLVHRFAGAVATDPLGPLATDVADIAADGATLALALPDAGRIGFAAPAGTPAAPSIGSCEPIALAIAGDRLAYVDRATSELVVHERPPGASAWGAATHHIALGRAGATTSIAWSDDGRIAVTDAERGTVWVLDVGAGALLAVRGQPAFVRDLGRPFALEPVCAAYATDAAGARRLAVLGRRTAVAWREHASPDLLPGYTLEAHAWTRSNLNADPSFGDGLAVDAASEPSASDPDRVLAPGWAEWSIDRVPPGTYDLWALYATEDPRALAIAIDGRIAIARAGEQITGGHDQRFLRWERLGAVTLEPGDARLRATAVDHAHYPHLARLRLVGPGPGR